MHIIKQAFKELYPDKTLLHEVSIKYSRKFKPYNANVKFSPTALQFNLSKAWKPVSREIRLGLIQNLLIKIFKQPASTSNIQLYCSFIKNLSRFAPKKPSDPVLTQSFSRVNNKYFSGMLDKSNLQWGSASSTKLGSYEYQTDTITISSILKSTPQILDYIMYHEILHKKHQFHTKSGRSYYHTPLFKQAEKRFDNLPSIEKELKKLCRKAKIKQVFFSNWFK